MIPVRTIERYQPAFDEHGMPKPVVPENDVAPWLAAVRELLSDRDAYERESAASRAAAEGFVRGLDAGAMERFLGGLRPTPTLAQSRRPWNRSRPENARCCWSA